MSITIEQIKPAPREFFSVEYIFRNPNMTVDAFIKENFDTGFHEQAFFEVILITRGSGYHALGDRLVEAKVGDVFIIPPYHRHAFVGGEGFDCFHFLLSPDFFKRNLPVLVKLRGFSLLFEIEPIIRSHGGNYRFLSLDKDPLDNILKLLTSLSKHIRISWPKTDSSLLISESVSVAAIGMICEEYSKGISENNADQAFMQSVSYIIENYSQRISIEELCSIANMSRTAYINKFKKLLGQTPGQFILKERISIAKSLLSTTGKHISAIAEECGFYDGAHFIKAFIADTGTTPTNYRKKE